MTTRILAPAAAAAALFAFPAAAMAEPVQDLTVKASPTKASTTKSPKSVALNVSLGSRETTPGAQPPTLSSVDLFFPAGSKYNGDLFPKCSSSSISAAKSTADCPSGSIVGKGKAAGLAPGPITQNDLTIVAANGGKNTVNLFVEGTSPLRIQSNIVGQLSKGSGDYGLKLKVNVPQNLQEPAPGVPVAITLFQVKIQKSIKVKGKTRGLVEITSCKGGQWKSKGDFRYAGGAPSTTVNVSQKCTK
ncbi:hypothetical protein LRS13_21445 [Svornostia abyssi]|uniref:Uncharacterized protein n=1 Tax=Svornostia abyssi TaxID=2898438 RepID=A0ABY5PEZ5_9ACTN|nr:hypothetical protein LRS13_21445 [Parviterribacteraceae bacterium J379]